MLTQIDIKDFKSYRSEALHLSFLTLMIGANASGKSNAIEAFRLLSWLAQGQKLDVLKHQVQDSEQIVRGNIRDLGYLGTDKFTLGCTTDDHDWNQFEIELHHRDDELHISQEIITSPEENWPLYRIEQPSGGLTNAIRVAYNNFKRGGKKPQITCTDQIAVLNQLASSALFEAGHNRAKTTIPEVTNRFSRLLGNTLFLDPVPSLMRDASYPEKRLKSDCSNLSGVLFNLSQSSNTNAAVIDFIRSLPEQDVSTFDFQESLRGAKLLELVENFGGNRRRWTADLLSDGTLRVLAIATALLSAQQGSTVIIEEVDNGVHPSRAKQLLATMLKHAQQRKVHLLLSTHNPALMDALPDAALDHVVFCYRDKNSGDSRLIRLSDLNDYPGLLSQGPLGELVTHGIVDRFVKSPISPQIKRKNAMDWLATLQGPDQ